MGKHKENALSGLNVVSLVISVCAFLLAIWQGFLQRENYHKSVQPNISIVPTCRSLNLMVGIYLFNSGTGPGYLDSIEITYKGKTAQAISPEKGLYEFVSAIGIDSKCMLFSFPRVGDPVMTNEMSPILSIGTIAEPTCITQDKKLENYLRENLSKIDITVKYRSIYGDKFIYNSKNNSNIAL